MSTLKRGGRLLSNFVRMHRPIKVAMLQCSTVGVNITLNSSSSNNTICWSAADGFHVRLSAQQPVILRQLEVAAFCCFLHSTCVMIGR
jgi:hypothetical protein